MFFNKVRNAFQDNFHLNRWQWILLNFKIQHPKQAVKEMQIEPSLEMEESNNKENEGWEIEFNF